MVVSPKFDSLGQDDEHTQYRLGIMGGTFDPIHIGHLQCAEEVREAFGLDGVLFIPAGDPWMKHDRCVTPAEMRYEMCARAVADNPYFDVSRIEIDRPGETYTVDTLRELRAFYPHNVQLFFISGADAIFNIMKWRESDEIPRLAQVVAMTRPGYVLSDSRQRYMRTHANFGTIMQKQVTALSISSTDLRKRVSQGKSIRYLTPASVAAYIAENGLYGSTNTHGN